MSIYKRIEISAVTFESVRWTKLQNEDRETLEMMLNICDSVRDQDFKTKTNQSFQNTGSACVKTRSSRAALVCLVLLCFLLLTAVIVLSVLIYTNYTDYTHERGQLLTRISNLTEQEDHLISRNTNFREEGHQLLTENTKLTKERAELLSMINSLTGERNNLKIENEKLLNERRQLMNHLQTICKEDGCIFYQSSFYYISSKTKNWAESRRDCQERGADLIIINNKEEQDFVMSITRGKECWIGLTDSNDEGRWKWVDGRALTSGFWASKEPNGGTRENCAVTYLKKEPNLLGWIDESCEKVYQWICEKRT